MSRQAVAAVENNFSKGLITEASGLNFPENSCVETYDCKFSQIGTVSRREGFDYENEYQLKTIDRTGSVISTYYWKNVTSDGTVSFLVQHIGTKLYFYDANFAALSLGAKTSTIDLTAFQPAGSVDPRIYECQFADGVGKLFVVHPQLEPFYVEYNLGSDTFSATQITVQIRDTQGLADTDATDLRPTSSLAGLSSTKHYNLLNQGWTDTNLTTWDGARADMPSNADVWWTFKNASDVFDTSTIANVARGNTPAPKGHFLLNVFSQGRSTVSGVTGITDVTTGANRPSCVAFFAGRVWYAGVNYTGYESNIYFSQITQSNVTNYGNCYQKQDPTSQDLFDLLPDDGGVVVIPDAGEIYKLFTTQSGLLVFTFRGVWLITGSTGIGFTASDYSVNKISNFNAISAASFVEVNGLPLWWNYEGIFTIEGTNVGSVSVKPLTLTTINTFYKAIPNSSKVVARGAFNLADQEVHWLYRSTIATSLQEQFEFDRVLILNLNTGAFYPWTVSSSAVKIHGVNVVYASPDVVELTVIDSSGNTVIDGAGDTVIAYNLSNLAQIPSFKYFCSYPDSGSWKFTYAEVKNTDYKDWFTYDGVGVNYSSYFKTGYKLHGSAQRKFQPMYVYFYNEDSGTYDVKGIWDYTTNSSSARITPAQTLTFDATNASNNFKRLKIRGNGMTLQFWVTSVSGEPFNISGWSSYETVNQLP